MRHDQYVLTTNLLAEQATQHVLFGVQLAHVVEAEAAFKKASSLDDPKHPGVHAMRVLAQMKQGLGDHWAAIRELTKAIDLVDNPEQIQCLFLRGAHIPACLPWHTASCMLTLAHSNKQSVSCSWAACTAAMFLWADRHSGLACSWAVRACCSEQTVTPVPDPVCT